MDNVFPGANYSVGFIAYFDDRKREVAFVKRQQVFPKRENYMVIGYKNIIGYEVLNDGRTVYSGGLGRAVVGGVLAGGAGAVVGAVTGRKSKDVSEDMRIKTTVKNMSEPAFYVPVLTGKFKKNGRFYKQAEREAHDICAKLDAILSDNTQREKRRVSSSPPAKNDQPLDAFEIVRKFKALADEGVISQEQFETKKKELLGL